MESCAVAVVIKPTESSVADENKQIETPYGTIEVIWLDIENNVIENPNEPKLTTGMEKVTWTKTGDTWTEDATAQAQWYNYKKETGKEDNLESMWANVKLDGSYFVWIPRYAYRITYYSDEKLENITGYYDGWGMWSAEDGTLKYKIDNTLDTVEYQGNKYIVHPAFMNDTENTWSNGGWDSDLSGIWVAKYEVSGSSAELNVVPNESSLRDMTIGEQYTAGINYGESIGNTSINSHMMKNSEWGAVAYLAHSQYGRNGHEVDINNSISYITGNGGGSTDANYQSGTPNPYNTTIGAKASTTGNVYGIYDMSGGAWERVSAFNSVDTNGYFSVSGWTTVTGLTTESNSTKYATKYENTGADYETTPELVMSKIGDDLIEVNKSIGSSSTSAMNHWFNDYSYIADSGTPFFARGGGYSNGSSAGLFYSNNAGGHSGSYYSFRLVLCF